MKILSWFERALSSQNLLAYKIFFPLTCGFSFSLSQSNIGNGRRQKRKSLACISSAAVNAAALDSSEALFLYFTTRPLFLPGRIYANDIFVAFSLRQLTITRNSSYRGLSNSCTYLLLSVWFGLSLSRLHFADRISFI